MASDLNELVTYLFGLAAVLMSALFYLQAHKTHSDYGEKFREWGGRADAFVERFSKIRRKAKQVRLMQQTKASVREAETLFSKATAKALGKVAVKAVGRSRK
ncbi:hypothetical protein COX86_00040 [Candidatus Micrarchaeota archaeon CG_4_10_14_0_2_um_filter_60_11]|nr:MAG: hypothetical protein AUJ16_01730 [Candidatus Micrarchaeota archaeon CG1_02_60_51]PIN95814.1 MAG: hypothetical protein COU39_03955 [Candidatus Micrarchaeota archaeon CG10_big_fil_rev_8_21_14_0_10_60_32]PIO02316.1 MAG: hypothetical protein COT58_00730 [Candidatus Micrarchaeota archaeon CG09_land_8_20_14_0_10_60_16]PIY91245.1 MAG: hypothetical protein COY71_04180 [Candidatus Micrarchaeota archaeon CG_4_10_14_0_8_um_filter_60_7]PIZ91369.1 MAG: hypothetical protein COX86_00040 [Candidatus Mi